MHRFVIKILLELQVVNVLVAKKFLDLTSVRLKVFKIKQGFKSKIQHFKDSGIDAVMPQIDNIFEISK